MTTKRFRYENDRSGKITKVWEHREGCSCKTCPWKGDCQGEDWPHWVEVKDGGKIGKASSQVPLLRAAVSA